MNPVWKHPHRRSHAATKVRPVQQHQWHFQSSLLVHLRGVGPCWLESMTKKASTWSCEIELQYNIYIHHEFNLYAYITYNCSLWIACDLYLRAVIIVVHHQVVHVFQAGSWSHACIIHIFPSTIGAAWRLKIFQHDNCMHESPKRQWSYSRRPLVAGDEGSQMIGFQTY